MTTDEQGVSTKWVDVFAMYKHEAARAEAAEQRAEALAAELAQARAEGEAAGRAAERADVVAMLRNAADEVGGVWMADAADGIEAGEHVGAAGGAA